MYSVKLAKMRIRIFVP